MGMLRLLSGMRGPALSAALIAAAAACSKASPAVWEPIDADFKGCEGG